MLGWYSNQCLSMRRFVNIYIFSLSYVNICVSTFSFTKLSRGQTSQFQWPRGLRRGSAAARSLVGWDCGFVSRRGHGCLSVVVVRYRSLRRAEHSYIVLPCMVCVSVIAKLRKWML